VLNAAHFGTSLDNAKRFGSFLLLPLFNPKYKVATLLISWEPILKEVEERYNSYLDEERRVNRRNITDKRIHCCLYFINPNGHSYPSFSILLLLFYSSHLKFSLSLKELDVQFLKRLHEKVNIIPVIARCDTLTPEEKTAFKKRIQEDLSFHHISIYEIEIDPNDDEETRSKNREFQVTPSLLLRF